MSLELVVIHLRATDNRCVRITQSDTQVHVHFGDDFAKAFPTMAKALFCIGGVIPWDEWDEPSRARLNELNNGRGAI